ncbi:MAG: hypothetical protein HLX50_11550 [Alteromonadaceae bacterium]|nr:hypothetical protein [Alteromonadaceae bacterium]
MTLRPRVLIVAEVGHRVGWGHISRCMILKQILAGECDVTVKVINREPWEDASLARDFALGDAVDADVVFADGLQLRQELAAKVRAGTLVSLSYVSDINEVADLVVAPALNGMTVPEHYVTDLSALVCNRPGVMAAPVEAGGRHFTVGISMGGADVEGLTPLLEAELGNLGHRTITLGDSQGLPRTLSRFLNDKLRECEDDPFPYYGFSGCDLVVCQGGLSAIEIALLGIPSVIRSRSDFTPAYGFLESLGCSLRSREGDIRSLLASIDVLSEDRGRRMSMVGACGALEEKIQASFWQELVHKLVNGDVACETMSVLWK